MKLQDLNTRKQHIAAVCVFRSSGFRENLEADLVTESGEVWWLPKSPKSLTDIAMKGENAFLVSFTSEDEGKNIRSVKLIQYLTDEEYKEKCTSFKANKS